jgi:hypothetical protein
MNRPNRIERRVNDGPPRSSAGVASLISRPCRQDACGTAADLLGRGWHGRADPLEEGAASVPTGTTAAVESHVVDKIRARLLENPRRTISVGKNADLVVIKGDPATHISDIENVEIVFKDGVGYDTQELLESAKGHYGEF